MKKLFLVVGILGILFFGSVVACADPYVVPPNNTTGSGSGTTTY